MADINPSSLKDWKDGDLVDATEYKQERSIIVTAVKDNWSRIIKQISVLLKDGSLKSALYMSPSRNTVAFKESDQIRITSEGASDSFQFSVVPLSIGTVQLSHDAVTEPNIMNGSVSTHKIALGAVTADRIATGTLDGRYYTETEVNTFFDSVKGLGYAGQTLVSLYNAIQALDTIFSTDAERIAAIADVINQFEIADEQLEQLIENKANKTDVYTKTETYAKTETYTKGEVNAISALSNTEVVDGGSFLDTYASQTVGIDGGTF